MGKDDIRLKALAFHSSKLMKELSEEKNEAQIKSGDFSPGKKWRKPYIITKFPPHLRVSLLPEIAKPLSANSTKWSNTQTIQICSIWFLIWKKPIHIGRILIGRTWNISPDVWML